MLSERFLKDDKVCNFGKMGSYRMKTILKRWGIIFCLLLYPTISHGGILFQESFEDTNFAGRGWYDQVPTSVIDNTEHAPVSGSAASLKVNWALGGIIPSSGNGVFTLRHKFTPTDSVYLGFWVKHTTNWAGVVALEGPHVMEFLTTADTDYSPLAWNHLGFYVEEWCSAGNSPIGTCAGSVRILLQDSANIDTSKINVNLVGVTENRAVAGCNGDSDGYGSWMPGAMSCYQSGGHWFNGKVYPTPGIYIRDSSGPYYKNDWHFIEYYIKLNTIAGGMGQRDGIIQIWFDGVQIYSFNNVVMRTGANPTMQFNQFVIGPYIGPGSVVDQQGFWIDNLTVATSRAADTTPPSAPQTLSIIGP